MMWIRIGIMVGAALFALIWKLSAPKKWQRANPVIMDELHGYRDKFSGLQPPKPDKPIGPPPNRDSAAKRPNDGGYTRDDETTYTAAAYQATESNPSGGNDE